MAPNDAVLVDDVLEYLNMDGPSQSEQAELTQYISAAVEVVEMYCGPILVREVVDHDQFGQETLVLRYRPVAELVGVRDVVADADLDVTGFRVSRDIGVVRVVGGGVFPSGPVDVTYRAGWADTVADVPASLALACQVIVAHLYGDQRRPTLGPQPEFFEDNPQTVSASGFAIPYKARDLMAPYRSATTVLMP